MAESEEKAGTRQRDQAYVGLRRMLILQQVPAGERLREPFWASHLGVNRMALREAFARLASEGLIEKGQRTGYVVARLGEADVGDILRARSILECGAIELICEDAARASRCAKQLVSTCEQYARLIEQRYELGASEADRRFHEALVESAESRRLALIYHHAPIPLLHQRLDRADQWVGLAEASLREHRAIVDAIARRDAAGAKRRLRHHLRPRGDAARAG